MQIYGYEAEKDGDLLNLSEVTLLASIEEMKKLNEFICFVLAECETHGDEFGHEHFNNFLQEKNPVDLVVCLKKQP